MSDSDVRCDLENADGIDDAGPTRSIGRNVAALLSSQAVTWVLATLLVWLVPRVLGAEPVGVLRLATSIWAIAAVFVAFGTPTMLTVEVARNRTAARALVASARRLVLSLFAIACPIVALVVILGPYDRDVMIVTAIAGGGALFGAVSTTHQAGLDGLQEMGHTARITVVNKLLLTVGTLVALALGGRLIAVASVGAVVIAVGAAQFVRQFRRTAGHLRAPTELHGRLLVVGAAPFLLAEATIVVYQQIDTIVISLLVDEEAIGYYGTADILFGSLLFVPVIVLTAMFPAIADLHKRAPHEVPALLRRSFRTLLLVALPTGLGTIVVAPSFVDFLYGDEFEDTAAVLAVFGIVLVLSTLTILLGRFALATGNVRFWSLLMVSVTVLSVPLDLVLVPWADRRLDNAAVGGALAYVVTESILIVVGIARFGHGLLDRSTAVRVAKVGVAGAAMLAAAWPLRDLFFVVPGAVAVGVYLTVSLVIRIPDDSERQIVSSTVARLRGRSGNHRHEGAGKG